MAEATTDGNETQEPREDVTFRTAAPAENRRTHARYAVDLEVSMSSEHNFYAALVENISAGGIFIATHITRPVGEQLELSIALPGGLSLHCTGEVRWTRAYSENSNSKPGLGIRFLGLSPEAAGLIERFVRNREPLLYDEG
jgi:uncharacterized protein (TIGR02266 family)